MSGLPPVHKRSTNRSALATTKVVRVPAALPCRIRWRLFCVISKANWYQESEVAYRAVAEGGGVRRRSCASSTGAESPGTIRSDTAGAPFNCCPARTGRATPGQPWMCSKDWTIVWQCSTRGAMSHLRKRLHARASFGASPREPRTHPSSISPPTAWAPNGRQDWRLRTPTTMLSSPSPPPVATGRDEFAKL